MLQEKKESFLFTKHMRYNLVPASFLETKFQKMAVVRHKEAIHSGHFMVSNFEAEAQDDEEDIAVPVRITKFIVVNMTS